MTVVNRNVASPPPSARCINATHVRWSCTVTKWNDRFGLFTNGQRHGSVDFMISLMCDPTDESNCTIAAWLAMGDRRKVVLPATAAHCTLLRDGELLHTDVTIDDANPRRMLTLTCRSEQLVFAQSPMLKESGFTGGSYDPPMLVPATSRCTAAHA